MYKKFSIFIWLFLLNFSLFAQDFRTVRDGIEYAEVVRGSEKEPVRAQILRLDLNKVRLNVVHAMDAAIGTEKTSSIAVRHGALAAINAGFFRLDSSLLAGDNVSSLQIDGKLLSESFNNRVALLINNSANRTTVSINHLNINGRLTIKRQNYDALGINRERKENDLVVFTPEFHRTTLTNAGGLEIIVRRGRIVRVADGAGSLPIPSDGFIISASGKRREEILQSVKTGQKANFSFSNVNNSGVLDENHAPSIASTEDIIGGVPLLVLKGKVKITWQEEKAARDFVEKRHPRTAVAKLRDGKFLLLTVDGRQEGYSVGMSLPELAEFLLELGAEDAMNLDGGGSTTMFVEGKIVNKPSDKEGERKVGDAILVFPRQK